MNFTLSTISYFTLANALILHFYYLIYFKEKVKKREEKFFYFNFYDEKLPFDELFFILT